MKGWPSAPGESLLTKDTFDVGTYGDLEAWLDSSSSHMMSTDASGTPPSNGDTVQKWYDLSGNQHHATVQENAPVWNTTGLNSKPTVAFTNDTMVLEDSENFNWNKFSVALVWQTSITSGNYTSLFGRSKSTNSWKDDAYAVWGMKAWRPDLATKRWDFHINTDTGSYNHQPSTNLISSDNILILRVNDVKMYVYLNGTRITNVDISGNKVSRTFKLAIGGADGGAGSASMNVSEFILFSNPINAVPVEGYLAHKWGLEGLLPSGHAHKTSSPVTLGGWSTGRAASGTDDIALSMTGAGDEFSQSVPVNDNQWHHLATTYDGSNKKIYLDGVEVATAAQTGAVTASEFKLYLGDPISAGGSPTRPKIDDVRIYGAALTAAEVAAIYNEGENDVGAQKFSVTSPSTMQGAVGKSVSYQITTDAAYGMTGYNSAITYTLLNKPSWLSVNSQTGKVSGTPPSAGTYSFQAKATNTLGTGIKDVTITVSDYANWNYALPFTTDYAGGSALKDWNMLVRLSEDSSNGAGNAGFRYSQLRSNGGDLRFVSKAGEELKYEIANWNTSRGIPGLGTGTEPGIG